jgi:hypothetical protein
MKVTTNGGTIRIVPVRKHGLDLFQIRVNGINWATFFSERMAVVQVQKLEREYNKEYAG